MLTSALPPMVAPPTVRMPAPWPPLPDMVFSVTLPPYMAKFVLEPTSTPAPMLPLPDTVFPVTEPPYMVNVAL